MTFTPAAAENGIEVLYDNITIYHNNTELKMTDANGNFVEPFIIDGTTYVPLRAIAEGLGMEVSFDEKRSGEKYIFIGWPTEKMQDNNIPYVKSYQTPGKKVISAQYVDISVGVALSSAQYKKSVILYNGTTFVAVRSVSEMLSKTVNWNGEKRQVLITDEVPEDPLAPNINTHLITYSEEPEILPDMYRSANLDFPYYPLGKDYPYYYNPYSEGEYLRILEDDIESKKYRILSYYDEEETLIWTNTFDFEISWYHPPVFRENGEVFIPGEISIGEGATDPVIVKIDSNGKIVDQKRFYGSKNDRFSVFYNKEMGLILYVSGYSTDGDFSYKGNTTSTKSIIFMNPSDLSIRAVYCPKILDESFEIYDISEDGIIAYSFSPTLALESKRNFEVVKVDKDGNEVFRTELNGSYFLEDIGVYNSHLTVLKDGGIIAVERRFGDGFYYLDKNGKILNWYGGYEYFSHRTVATNDGGFISIGNTVTKFDKNLNIEWRKKFASYVEPFVFKDGSVYIHDLRPN